MGDIKLKKYKSTNQEKSEPTSKYDLNIEVSYTDKKPVETGEKINHEDMTYDFDGVKYSDFKQMFTENGGNVDEIMDKIIQFVKDNKNDENLIRNFFGNFLGDVKNNLYDVNKDTKYFGDSIEEIMSKVLSVKDGESLPGWVCTNNCELGMGIAHSCGYESATVSCKSLYGAGHSILIYKSSDGTYSLLNYGKTNEIKANNMKDAVCQLLKFDSSLLTNGTISFVDKDKSFYEFALSDDVVWGDKIDKRANNMDFMFHNKLPSKSKVDIKVDSPMTDNMKLTAEGTILLGKNKNTALSAGIGGLTNTDSQFFDSSKSFGAKVGIKGVKKAGKSTDIYYSADVLADYALTNVKKNDNTNRKAEYLVGAAKGVVGAETKIPLNDNTTLTNAAQISAEGNIVSGITLGTSYTGDSRLAIGDGLKLTNKFDGITLENSLSGEFLTDTRSTLGAQELSTQSGSRFRLESSILAQPNENLSYGLELKGASVFTKSSDDYYLGAKTFVQYKPESSEFTFGGSADATYGRQYINIGGLNELTENDTSLKVSLSAKHKKDTYSIGYDGKFHQNTSRNKSTIFVGYSRTF